MEEMEKPEMKKGRKGSKNNHQVYDLEIEIENNYEHHHREIKCGKQHDRRKAHRQCHHKEVLLALCFRVKRERREGMWWAEEFGNGRHIRVKFKRTDDVKRRREEIGGL